METYVGRFLPADGHDLSEAVALSAKSVRTVDAEIWVGKKIGD